MKNILLIGVKTIKAESVIEQNVDDRILAKTIATVQEVQLRPILGTDLYDTVCTAIKAKVESNTEILEPYKTLVDDFIQPYLTYATIAEFIALSTFKISNKGIQKLTDASSSVASNADAEYLKNYYDNYTASYKDQLIKYLKEADLLPKNIKTDTDIQFPATGWFLKDTCGYGSGFNYESLPDNPTLPEYTESDPFWEADKDNYYTKDEVDGLIPSEPPIPSLDDVLNVGDVSDEAIILGIQDPPNNLTLKSKNLFDGHEPIIQFNKLNGTASIRADNFNQNYDVWLPKFTGDSANLPLTVNSIGADDTGNIVLPDSPTPTLQQVAMQGNTATINLYVNDNGREIAASGSAGTAGITTDSTDGTAILYVLNAAGSGKIKGDNITASRVLQLPDADGTFALVEGTVSTVNGNTAAVIVDLQSVLDQGSAAQQQNISLEGTTAHVKVQYTDEDNSNASGWAAIGVDARDHFGYLKLNGSGDVTATATINANDLTDTRNFALPDAHGTFLLAGADNPAGVGLNITSSEDTAAYVSVSDQHGGACSLRTDLVGQPTVWLENSGGSCQIQIADVSGSRIWQMPDADGTIALVGTQDLQKVLDAGSSAENSNIQLTFTGGQHGGVYIYDDNGSAGFAALPDGRVAVVVDNNLGEAQIFADNLTDTRVFQLPDQDGTLALLSDITGGGGSSAYQVYSASLQQRGTDAPIATILENTTGQSFTWNYAAEGVYYVTCDNPDYLTTSPSQVFVMIGGCSDYTKIVRASFNGADNEIDIAVSSLSSPSIGTDDTLNYTAFEIRVYA